MVDLLDGWATTAQRRRVGGEPVRVAPGDPMTPIGQTKAFVAATGTQIAHGGTRAFYRASTDSIQLPPREAFIGSPPSAPAESYYSTLLHELTHWTSAESRRNRQLGKRFGDDAYATEELVYQIALARLLFNERVQRAHATDDARRHGDFVGERT